ncbi:DUF2397 family protein [Streptomyces sp. ALI-76-A]|uniref:DUF2397 family protein n=1 Tax=Streptomyces sp. ALI-76-A TaxID=3025736 RepID=UPI00256EA54F|nr:DUF2397 family protein [Streptomyces sp. ALI-76-A]MDL5198613.1 DUF2397 family protein [Streptomyces sp. ALI-76-A]
MGIAVPEVPAGDSETDWVVEGWADAGMAAGDPARVVGYVLSPLRGQYLAIMEVLEQSVDHLTPAEVRAALAAEGTELPLATVTTRLRALSDTFLAASGRPDSEVERWHELNGARWRYSATPRGRQMQRLWTQLASDGLVPREIPMDGLSRIQQALAAIHGDQSSNAALSELAGQVFVEHDHLDGALVGQADMLAQLADRFNLDLRATGELKQLILEYATHVVVHLDAAVVRIHAELVRLRPRFAELAAARRGQSPAGALVARGVLAPARGLRAADWEQLLGWFSPGSGKAARFGLQLVRAIPMLHANLLRHQSVGGPATLRARALSLAVACQDPHHGRAVLRQALADRPWTKLHTVAEADTSEVVSWHEGPRVAALAMLRATGQSSARGAVTGRKPRDESEAVRRRAEREARHGAAVAEVLAGAGPLSDAACRLALRAVMAAARALEDSAGRIGQAEGVGCTLVAAAGVVGRVEGVRWSVLVPGRRVLFHPPVAVAAGRVPAGRRAEPAKVAVLVEAAR